MLYQNKKHNVTVNIILYDVLMLKINTFMTKY